MITETRKNLIRTLEKFGKENKNALMASTHRFWDDECECYNDFNEEQFLSYFSRCLRKRTLSEEEWKKVKMAYKEISRNEESVVSQEFLNEIMNNLREIYCFRQN